MGNLNGKKVKINTGQILSRQMSFSKKYLRFLTKNADTVFTAEEYASTKITGVLYTLREDESELKWLFYERDLTPVDGLDILDNNP